MKKEFDKSFRKKDQDNMIYGVRAVIEAIRAEREINRILRRR
jgi:tRNA G18 (ribose-2'-O)-methylase SpoU